MKDTICKFCKGMLHCAVVKSVILHIWKRLNLKDAFKWIHGIPVVIKG